MRLILLAPCCSPSSRRRPPPPRSTRGGKTVRLRYPARKARRGDHKVRITVVRGSRRTTATLTSRRL